MGSGGVLVTDRGEAGRGSVQGPHGHQARAPPGRPAAGGPAPSQPVLAGLCGGGTGRLPPSRLSLSAPRRDGDEVGQAQGNGEKATGKEGASRPGPGTLRVPASIRGQAFQTKSQC